MLKVPGRGPLDAEIIIVGEAPGGDEEIAGVPFIGASGKELDRWLKEVGLDRSKCYVTNVCKYRPPANDMEEWLTVKKTVGKKKDYTLFQGRYAHPLVLEGVTELMAEIAAHPSARIIIGLGNTALWALTGQWGIGAWRGSEMNALGGIPFVPTLHPSAVLRQWKTRPYVIHDLKQRVVHRLNNGFIKPEFDFNSCPTYDEVIAYIQGMSGDVAGDIETSQGHVICLGLATSATHAMCIPFRNGSGVVWSQDEVEGIMVALVEARKRCNWIGQNWNYDAQYMEEDFNVLIMADFDTYIGQSVLFPGVDRKLGFLASMYCEWHCYWKDDIDDWGKIADFDSLFRYNCRDAAHTWEVAQKQKMLLEKSRLTAQFTNRMRYSYSVYKMMRRGVNRDHVRTNKMLEEVGEFIHSKELLVAQVAGKPINFDSPKQVADLFYKQFGCKPPAKRGKPGKVSTDDETLKKVIEAYPQHAPTALAILEARSYRSLRSNFLLAQTDPDGRFRSSWSATGTETFRLTSSQNAFYRGGPLQNITDGKHTHSGRALPNLRSCIVPDIGYVMGNCDLERADLQVVVWEANDEDMKQKLREHVDVHTENAKDLYGLSTVTEQQRHFGKTFVHLTNYGGTARTCALRVACTVHQADLMQRRWFQMHPGILEWHRRTSAYLTGTRTVTNRFGYRRIYFDRVEGLLPEALAWLPQSTIGILISLQQMAIEEQVPEVEMLMQGHDSVIFQYRQELEADILPRIQRASHIAVPYEDPLYIPLELATSTSSWGEVEKRPWPTGLQTL